MIFYSKGSDPQLSIFLFVGQVVDLWLKPRVCIICCPLREAGQQDRKCALDTSNPIYSLVSWMKRQFSQSRHIVQLN